MHRRISILILFGLLAGGPLHWTARAEVIDKIMAAQVDGRIITLSDIRNEREIAAVLGDPPETDDSILKSLIDRALVESEMAQYPNLEVDEDKIDEQMKQIRDFRGVSPADIRRAIVSKLQRRRYFEVRYRQYIVVSNEEIEKYYETKFVPEVKQRGAPVPPLDQVINDIRENIVVEKLSQELELSLEVLRERSKFEVLQ